MSTHWRFLTGVLAGTLLLSGGLEQSPAAPVAGTAKETKQLTKITQADRQAAADRAAATGFALPTLGAMVMAPAGAAPHYFDHPNYANSPLPIIIPTEVVISSSSGAGATATATVAAGVVTGVTLTNPGSGYDTALSVTVDITGGATPATATATVDPATGTLSAITLVDGGSGYDAVQAGTGLASSLTACPDWERLTSTIWASIFRLRPRT